MENETNPEPLSPIKLAENCENEEETYEVWEERHKNKCKERITMILSSILPHLEGIAFNGKLGTQKTKIIGPYLIDTLLSLRKRLGLIEILLNFEDLSECAEGISRISKELQITENEAKNPNICALGFF